MVCTASLHGGVLKTPLSPFSVIFIDNKTTTASPLTTTLASASLVPMWLVATHL